LTNVRTVITNTTKARLKYWGFTYGFTTDNVLMDASRFPPLMPKIVLSSFEQQAKTCEINRRRHFVVAVAVPNVY